MTYDRVAKSGQDVEIVVKAKPRNRERGRIHVVGDAHT
jgi:hypothetical protein